MCHGRRHVLQPIGAGDDKFPWLVQSHLSWEQMPGVPCPAADKSQMLVGLGGFFWPVGKGLKSDSLLEVCKEE